MAVDSWRKDIYTSYTRKTPALSAALCGLIEERLGIPASRIYIEFADAPRAMWGWDGRTF